MQVPIIKAPSVRSAPMPGFRERRAPDAAGQTGAAVKAIGQMASSTWNMLEQEKAKADAARAVQELGDFTRDADAVLFDPTVDEATKQPKGFKYRQGEFAFGGRQDAIDSIDALVEQHISALNNDAQKAAFRAQADAKVTAYQRQIHAHAGNEAERAQTQAYKVNREIQLNHAASLADDIAGRTEALKGLSDVASAEARNLGLSSTAEEEWVQLAQIDGNATVMNSLLAKGNIKEAESFYATVKDKLGAQGDRIARYLAEAKAQVAVEVKSSEIVKAAILPGYSWINQEKAMATVEAMEPSAEKDRVRTLVEHHIAKLEQLRRNTADKKFNHALAIHELTGTLENQAGRELRSWFLDPNNAATNYWKRLNREIQTEKRAGRTSDAQERREQMDRNRQAMAEYQALEPGEQVRFDINARFKGFADQTTLFRLERIQNASKRIVEGGGLAKESEFRRFAQQAAKDVGLSKETAADFQTYVADWRATYLQENDGREPTRKEMQQAVADALLFGERTAKESWFQPNRYKFQAERKGESFEPFAPEEQKYKPSSSLGAPAAPAPPARGRSLDVPADERAQITEALKASGKAVTEDAIKDRYARMLSRRGG
jgi:hypothetical protein